MTAGAAGGKNPLRACAAAPSAATAARPYASAAGRSVSAERPERRYRAAGVRAMILATSFRSGSTDLP